ncbi:hypothetical protein KAH81_01735, partial [bacterium]|nr:hypothetical protein [bacterium]
MKVVFVLLVSGLISYSTLSTSEVLFSEVEGIPSSEEDIEFLSPDSLSFALESEPAETLVTDTSIVDSLILSDDSSRTRPEEPMFVGLEIGTAGEDVYIASDHVGIGTSTPSELLEIYNGNLMIRGNDGATMRIGEGVDYYEMILDYDVGDEGTGLFIRSNGTDRVTMLSTG